MLSVVRQEIIHEKPPNFADIVKVCPTAIRVGVIFSWGDKIYNPSKVPIPRHLIAHEGVHGYRQRLAGIEKWWDRYLKEPLFRLDEEIYAHHQEYLVALRNIGPGSLRDIANRLCGPLYGGLLNYDQAVRAILTGEVK